MSIKLKFRASSDANKEGSLYFQVIHGRSVRQIPTSYHILASEWNEDNGKIIISSADTLRKEQLCLINDKITWLQYKIQGVVTTLERNGGNYTTDDIVVMYQQASNECESVFEFMRKQVERLKKLNRIRTSETYQATLNSFMRFRENVDLTFGRLDSDLMELYEAYMKGKHLKRNTSSFYMRILRTIYNKAVEEGLTIQNEPFKRVYTGIDKTEKRAISLADIKEIKELDLTGNSSLDYARDMFLMSFYLRGMPFVDMAYLKKKDLQNGFVKYCRQKTEQQLIIQWETHMQTTMAKYQENATRYLLPIISTEDGTERKQYCRKGLFINRKLKVIGKMLGLDISLSMYVARHSWASAARDKDVPLSVISMALGHDSEATTQIYLSSISTSVIDQANDKVLKDL